MFGFIKKLLGGIFSFLGGLFGKKEEFYLELNEEVGSETAKNQSPEVKVTPTVESQPVQAKQEAPVNPEPATVSETPTPSKTPTPEKEPVAAAVTTVNFATDYLMPSSSNSRRRPGANMNSFLDMARQVKVPG